MSVSPLERIDSRSPLARLTALADADSFQPFAPPDDCGTLAGQLTIEGIRAVAFATDPAIQGGAMGRDGCARIVHAIESAVRLGCPVIGLWHSGGARLREGVASLDGVGRIFAAIVSASGVVPQISVVLGPAAGGAAYGPALTDIVVLGPNGRIFVTGPDVVRSVTGEDVDMLRLGGPEPHGRRSGVASMVCDTDEDALDSARRLAVLLADQRSVGDVVERDLSGYLPESARRAYDVHALVDGLLDDNDPHAGPTISGAPVRVNVELHAKWARNVVTTLGRLGGRTVGVIANNPLRLGGCLDAASAEKAARFVRMCDAFGVPLVVVVDVPGYLPGVTQEWDGVVRRGAKLLHAFAHCSVPRVTLVTRKAFGGAYIAMNSRSLGATAVYAWPDAVVDVMGPEAAVGILHRRRLAEIPEARRSEVVAELVEEHSKLSGGLERARELDVIDEMVSPASTRGVLAAAIALAPPARGRWANIPL
jgi:acetyl-CoA/propionyl-CoA carboxylase carboxyl transferase subunit